MKLNLKLYIFGHNCKVHPRVY